MEYKDWDRAIKYHEITLKLTAESVILNVNEYVYLAQQISNIHLKLNDFSNAEQHIHTALITVWFKNQEQVNPDAEMVEARDGMRKIDLETLFKDAHSEQRLALSSLCLMLANLYMEGNYFIFVKINVCLVFGV